MNSITLEELKTLATPQDGYCISIFMPTIEKSQEVRQNMIRFKNLVDDANDQLVQAGMTKPEVNELLAPLHAQLVVGSFWQHQDRGLAVFLSTDIYQVHHLPIEVEELVIINNRFHLKPLVPLLYRDDEFYILALSRNQVRLMKADQNHVEEVHPHELPQSMDDALGYDNISGETVYQNRTGQARGGGGRMTWFHGHMEGDDREEEDVMNFLRKVNAAVSDYLADSRAPLIIAGVEYIHPMYKDANTYKHLAEQIVTGNPDGIRAEELHLKAWEQIKHVFDDNRGEIVGRYKQLAGWKDNRATKDVKEVIKAAPYGRVEVLFVDKNAKRWGTFDTDNVDVKFENEPRPGNQDLIDFAAVQTLLNGGTVYVVESEEVPEEGSPVAAILRY